MILLSFNYLIIKGIEISPPFNLTWSKPDFYIIFYYKKLINVELILIKILIVPLSFNYLIDKILLYVIILFEIF